MLHETQAPHDEQTPAGTRDPREQAIAPDMDFPDPPPKKIGPEPVSTPPSPGG